jgi:hypothetical protein
VAGGVDIRGLAHITGGGLVDNPPRIFPEGVTAVLHRDRWPEPAIFDLIQQTGKIDPAEMVHVFNMGLGMLVIIPPDHLFQAQQALGEALLVGEMVAGDWSCYHSMNELLDWTNLKIGPIFPPCEEQGMSESANGRARIVVMISGSGTNLQA